MKLLLKKLIPGVVLFSLLGGTALAQRVATVDVAKVIEKYWKTQEADTALKAQVADIEKSDKEMIDGWKKAKDDYQKLLADANDQAVSSEERDKRKNAAEDKLKEIKDTEDNITMFERQARARVAEQKSRMRKNILEEIKIAINTKAKASGYTLVVDSGAQTYLADPGGPYYSPVVLFNSGDNDITDAVISQLNAGAPIDTRTETPKADDKKTAPASGKNKLP